MRHEEGRLLDRLTAALRCLTANRRGKRATPLGFSPYLLWLPLRFAEKLHSTALMSLATPVPPLYGAALTPLTAPVPHLYATAHTSPGLLLFAAAHTAPGPLVFITARTAPILFVTTVTVHD